MCQRAKLDSLELEPDGAQRFRHVLTQPDVESILLALRRNDLGKPGSRLSTLSDLRFWLSVDGPVGRIVAKWLGQRAAPVRAILFDKNAAANWALAWHQDRTIAVAAPFDVSGFDNWNRKNGIDHVEPPFGLIESMITVRVHLDKVDADNAPLLISPGTHRLGRIAESAIPEVVERHGSIECPADAGDVWAYRTAILHASKRAAAPNRRRVLQVDYSSEDLPDPLRWYLKQ